MNRLCVVLLIGRLMAACSAWAAEPAPGLITQFTSGAQSDTQVTANVWLYVPSGQSATPFLPAGKISVVWTGYLTVDLRDEYQFMAELNGTLKVILNGQVALESAGPAAQPTAGPRVRLNKGANALQVTYTSPEAGDALVRLLWSSAELPWEPVPTAALTHRQQHSDLEKAEQLRLGRGLVIEHRCLKCHLAPSSSANPELTIDAPSFEAIGSRRNYAWMARWILDPHAARKTARMPRMFSGPSAPANAEAIAAFLASLNSLASATGSKDPPASLQEEGRQLFSALHCEACHDPPGGNDPAKIALDQLREKFAPGALAAFILKPEADYAWIRMPRFKLSSDQVSQLTSFLLAHAEQSEAQAAPNDAGLIQRGKKLVQTSGCLNCHPLNLENQFATRKLPELGPDRWSNGCMAPEPDKSSKAPLFSFTSAEREALRAWASSDRASITRHDPAEFVERQIRQLNCRQCHGKFEGVSGLESLGGKLKPEWTRAFIAGQIEHKPRPWLEAQMPAFPQYAQWLAAGMAMQEGYPPRTPAEPPIDNEAAKIGQKLVSANGGFSCVACHGIGEMQATQIFESAGVNLAYANERLLPDYFERWMLNPLRIDPQTKMPVYFDHGKSPLTDIYDGDALKQIDALWQYIRLGPQMPLPD